MPWTASIDMYRKVPADLLEGTRRGSFFSVVAVIAMTTLFLFETREFLKISIITDLALDNSPNKQIRLWFNMTMMDLSCDNAVVDVVSVLGTEQNVTAHVHKFTLDAAGVRQRYLGRNKEQKDVKMFDEDLHVHREFWTGESDVVDLDPESFSWALEENDYVFIDFFASWCSHCQHLAPTWEVLGELMNTVAYHNTAEHKAEHLRNHGANQDDDDAEAHDVTEDLAAPILIGKVDCVAYESLCDEWQINSYPSIILFVEGEYYNEYMGHRTILEMTNYLATVEKDFYDTESHLHSASMEANKRMGVPEHEWRQPREMKDEWHDEDHPGCHLNGVLMVDRVPGSFQVVARSKYKTLIPSMTNVSHEIHNLTFGPPTALWRLKYTDEIMAAEEVKNHIDPLQGNVYVSELHEAYHHHMKLVPTNFYSRRDGQTEVYQILTQSQLAHISPSAVPDAKFSYDLSPVAVTFRTTSRKWYDYLTSIMAIVGGTFTLVGIFESSVRAATTKKRR